VPIGVLVSNGGQLFFQRFYITSDLKGRK